ncbi:hypothetical protein ACIQBJ_03280 [Kitasatospora sp. NPDC088391]|uniref:hypothetical protein n=1 Tax=Kitasatospora sp. NPDC088391 TaxID=3364074 RepID=UPI00382BDA93
MRGRATRWVAAGAAVVVIGGGVAVAFHHEGEDRGDGKRSAAAAGERADGRDGPGGHDGQGGHEGRTGRDRETDDGVAARQAPAPLPSLDAADAVVKAAGAVLGGKVESLGPVTEQGGGRAWRAVVLGPDGVRHAVVVDSATFSITGNTVLGG